MLMEVAMGEPRKFIWLANYVRLFKKPRFWNSIRKMREKKYVIILIFFIISFTLIWDISRESWKLAVKKKVSNACRFQARVQLLK